MRFSTHCAAALALALAGTATAADSLLSYAPADTQIVIGINIRKIADTPFVQAIIKEKGGEKAEAQLAILQGAVGVDLMKDLDRAWLWGRADDDDSIGIAVEGRINQEKLLNLLKANEKYASATVDGVTVHEWKDEKEKRMKYGVFLPEGAAAVFNTKAALTAALSAKKAGDGFVAGEDAKRLPTGHADAAAFGLIIKPKGAGKDGKFKETLKAEAASAMLKIDGETLTADVAAVAESPEAAQSWLDLAKGFVALLKLQGDNAGLSTLAGRAKVDADEPARTVKLSVSATVPELTEWAKQGKHK
jgi:hypothetical protein